MEKERGAPIPLFLASKALEPSIEKVFEERHLSPIQYSNNDVFHKGYPAENPYIVKKHDFFYIKDKTYKENSLSFT